MYKAVLKFPLEPFFVCAKSASLAVSNAAISVFATLAKRAWEREESSSSRKANQKLEARVKDYFDKQGG